MRSWRNWYTRSTKDAVEKSLGVQVPPVAPSAFARKSAQICVVSLFVFFYPTFYQKRTFKLEYFYPKY